MQAQGDKAIKSPRTSGVPWRPAGGACLKVHAALRVTGSSPGKEQGWN